MEVILLLTPVVRCQPLVTCARNGPPREIEHRGVPLMLMLLVVATSTVVQTESQTPNQSQTQPTAQSPAPTAPQAVDSGEGNGVLPNPKRMLDASHSGAAHASWHFESLLSRTGSVGDRHRQRFRHQRLVRCWLQRPQGVLPRSAQEDEASARANPAGHLSSERFLTGSGQRRPAAQLVRRFRPRTAAPVAPASSGRCGPTIETGAATVRRHPSIPAASRAPSATLQRS
jgi:hypothetical protein